LVITDAGYTVKRATFHRDTRGGADKVQLREAAFSSGPEIEKWAFFFLFADAHQAERLWELLS
jgi:hypothetical protein